MKKIVLIIMAVMAFAGMSMAQDVYSAGYTGSGSSRYAAVFQNGSLLYQTGDSRSESYDVVVNNGYVYWIDNCFYEDGTYYYGDIYRNNSRWFNSPTGSGYHINDLFLDETGFSSTDVLAAGCMDINGLQRAVIWTNDNTTPYLTLGNTSYKSEAKAGTRMYDGSYWTITVGVQYTSSTAFNGVVWKASDVLYNLGANVDPQDVAVYDGEIYTVANVDVDGSKRVKVYRNGTELYTLTTSNSRGWGISIDAGDIYVCGWEGDYFRVWKNGAVWDSFTGSGNVRDLEVNINGRYYAGVHNNQGKIWRNTTVLYSPTSCSYLYGIHIDEPECTNNDILALPFHEGFEQGSSSWACWTKIDVDNQNQGRVSYWDRVGKRLYNTMGEGNECARHLRNPSYAQEGWLITPRLFLQPGRDNTTLTFKTMEYRPSYYGYEGVWISTSSDPTDRSSYQQVWTQNSANASTSWKDVTVDLSDYQGEAVYIAFKYTGNDAHVWLIDDVNVTEDWSSCGTLSVPYSISFDNDTEPGYCWFIDDHDQTGDNRCWKYNSSEHCVYHPWGQSGQPQMGFLCSPRINLLAGHDYVLKFRTKNSSSGAGMANRIYLKQDETGIPNPGSYTTLIWNDTQFPTSWTEIEVPLTAYAGHTITLNFAYYGTWAHNWFIDDVRIEEAVAQYTITANANNNDWGTVTGGGTYQAGATCTLHATPTSGYQFDSWKKNGSVVSTNPNYSFTVTENATYTAYFSETPVTYYTITTNVTPSGAGTVTGGGTFPEGTSVTLTANANNGYTFSQWQDGNTQNPRTITVTGNATYTASFTQDTYIITTAANPPAGGSVTGGGAFHYGDTPTLTATANSGYEFAGWQDGNTENPRQITVTGNATYTATFSEVGATYFTVTASVSPSGAGTVNGTGTYEAGSVIILTAEANPGYTFDHWNDGSTANPRSVTVNSNLNFTAYFNHNQYTITVNANPSNAGTVSGGGAYYYGDYATLTATPYSGYEFVGWNDGSSANPHQVMVTGNATYTATFSQSGSTYYTVSVYVSPTGAGTVSGAGTFPAGASTTLTATANNGYTFAHWNDGSTQNPRTVTVNNNMSFTAYFNAQEYTITTNVTPDGSGTVTGGGTYTYGSTATLTATPNSGYEFLQWSDGDLQNPRIITVTGNATYTALFSNGSGDMFVLTVTSNSPLLGHVFGGGVYPAGSEVEISAYPTSYAHFVKWDDGNTDNPRRVVVNSDLEFIAEFAASQNYTITVESADPERGQAYGGGTFMEGNVIEISAVAFEGYMFEKWNDGNTQNPRQITVTSNATYTAYFADNSVVTHTLQLICNTSEGTVSGGGVYVHGSVAMIGAFPNDGYTFDKWSDENTQNPRQIVVNEDMTLVAFFKGTGVDEIEGNLYVVFPNPATESIRIEGIETNTEVKIYSVLGELVKVVNVNGNEEISIKDLASGLYMIRFGNTTLRFSKVQ